MKIDTKKQLNKYPDLFNCRVGVIGMGYVGLPLALEFGKEQFCNRTGSKVNRQIIGYDINEQRLKELRSAYDRTNETTREDINKIKNIEFTSDKEYLVRCDVFIVTVPTPIDIENKPDLLPLKNASKTVGEILKYRQVNGNSDNIPIIIYESTVYPGATEEICVPILEKESGLKFNEINPLEGFVCGYSPERINPGDKNHRLTNIVKVTSGSNKSAAKWIDDFYGSIIKAGTHLAPSIQVAEAAKVIENTQRDLNIALVNELAIIFNKLNIDTLDVLDAAATKWNFLHFKPGLVGGHCIGVDPYYLTYKSEQMGYSPEVVLAGRRINDRMSSWVVEQLVLAMAKNGIRSNNAKVLLLGLTFKENCPDMRNTKVIDLIKYLHDYGITEYVVDPWVDIKAVKEQYGFNISKKIPLKEKFSAVICAVAHEEFSSMKKEEWEELLEPHGIYMDLKGLIPRELNSIRL